MLEVGKKNTEEFNYFDHDCQQWPKTKQFNKSSTDSQKDPQKAHVYTSNTTLSTLLCPFFIGTISALHIARSKHS